MARPIRFSLSMKDGAAVRNLEELRKHFDLESVLGYFADGRLRTWLENAYEDDKAEAVGRLTADMPDLAEKLCNILGVEYTADAEKVDIEAALQRNEKLRRLSSITADQKVLDNIDHAATNQEELMDLLANPPETIYLCGGPFSIPSDKKNISYVGVGADHPEVMLDKGKLIADYDAAGITFKDVRYISPYRTEAEQLYLDGRYAKALPLLEEAAGQGNPRAMYMAAMCFQYGFGTHIDMKKCREWLQKSFGMKEPLSSMQYAYTCCQHDEAQKTQILTEFAEELKALALSGDYLAQFEYWYYVLNNRDKYTAQDCAQAVEWFRRAAEQGYARAQCSLGVCCEIGRGVEQNDAKAAEWYRKAAEQGDAIAQFNLGKCYYNGRGVEQDYAQAVEWYRKAAEQGHADAQNDLGVCYEDGKGIAQDSAIAVEWYRKAVEQGHIDAKLNLGMCYEYGDGVEQDYTKAFKLYRQAAGQGYAKAKSYLQNDLASSIIGFIRNTIR